MLRGPASGCQVCAYLWVFRTIGRICIIPLGLSKNVNLPRIYGTCGRLYMPRGGGCSDVSGSKFVRIYGAFATCREKRAAREAVFMRIYGARARFGLFFKPLKSSSGDACKSCERQIAAYLRRFRIFLACFCVLLKMCPGVFVRMCRVCAALEHSKSQKTRNGGSWGLLGASLGLLGLSVGDAAGTPPGRRRDAAVD